MPMYAATAGKVRLGATLLFLAVAAGCVAATTCPAAAADTSELCDRIDRALAHARDSRRLDAGVHGAWQIVHGILAFGPDFPLVVDGKTVTALDHLLGGGSIAGWRLRTGDHGVIAIVEEGSTTGQGHPDQWLGYLSQCGTAGIPLDTKLRVAGRNFTVKDLLTQAQADIRPGQEATWTLMALAAYLPADAAWTARDGTKWTTERVVRMEAANDLSASACGGAHRLYGLVRALEHHMAATGTPRERLTGGWAIAADVIDDAMERAREFQQADGSFSIHSFDRPGTSADVFAKLSATGHVFEVVVAALDERRLAETWVTRAAERLVALLEQTDDIDLECGGLYHAAHGLLLYRQRVCQNPSSLSLPR